MAMLPEILTRKKCTLNPRGKFWSDDNNKFGQKILEDMGWSKGKGLGRNEDGMTDPIKVKCSSDRKGVGCKGNADDWISHQDDFSLLLASLNENVAQDRSEPKNQQTERSRLSLEQKSKFSHSRIHYHKFIRGKDLSKYSEDDLSHIFGRKKTRAAVLTPVAVDSVPVQQMSENTEDATQESEIGTTENFYGIKTIKGGNMQQYFAKKIAKLKTKVTAEGPEKTSISDYCENNVPDVLHFNEAHDAGVQFNSSEVTCNFTSNEDLRTGKKQKKKKNAEILKKCSEHVEICASKEFSASFEPDDILIFNSKKQNMQRKSLSNKISKKATKCDEMENSELATVSNNTVVIPNCDTFASVEQKSKKKKMIWEVMNKDKNVEVSCSTESGSMKQKDKIVVRNNNARNNIINSNISHKEKAEHIEDGNSHLHVNQTDVEEDEYRKKTWKRRKLKVIVNDSKFMIDENDGSEFSSGNMQKIKKKKGKLGNIPADLDNISPTENICTFNPCQRRVAKQKKKVKKTGMKERFKSPDINSEI